MATLPLTNVQPLAQMIVGQKALLNRENISRKLEKKLLALGFSNLMPILLIQKRKGGIVVGIGNARIALDEALARQVSVKVA